MAIPIGTTSRQLRTISRWLFAGVVIVGVLTWWRPGHRSWGAMAVGMLVPWALWLAWQTVSAERTVPGNPVHLVLLGPVAVLTYHHTHVSLAGTASDPQAFGGALNMSMILQIALVALGMLLAQSLLPRLRGQVITISACGAAMMGGMAAAIRASAR